MSAWMCSEKHIGGLAKAILNRVGFIDKDGNRPIFSEPNPDKIEEEFRTIASRLERANRDSIAHRYGPYRVSEMCGPRYKWKSMAHYPEFTAAECVKLGHCYEYQSCEVSSWRRSKAYRDVCALIFSVTFDYPGTDAVQWGI